MKFFNWRNLVFILILIGFGLYAARFIERTSFVIDGERYYTLFDDAMISMRYAQNLAAGNGLVWNPGERVEGFSNPLWVFFMAAIHFLPLPLSKTSLAVQISGAVFLAANLFAVKKIGEEISENAWVSLGAVFLTAFFFSLNNWALQGMEVSALTFLFSLCALSAIRVLKTGQFSYWLYVILGVTTLIRMDMAAPYIITLGFFLLLDPINRKKHAVHGAFWFIFFIGIQTAARYAYYGELLPNTYYLKLSGVPLPGRIRAGLGAFRQFVWNTGWLLFVFPFLSIAIKPRKATILLGLLVLGQIAYSIYVGGDAWEHRGGTNRFLTIMMPLFFLLFVHGFTLSLKSIFRSIGIEGGKYLSPAVTAGFILLSLFSFNTILANDPVQRWTLEKRPVFVDGSERIALIGLAVKDVTMPDAVVAVVSAGGIPYFSQRSGVDLYGKMDKTIARLEPRTPRGLEEYADIRPGHAKWDYDYSIGELQPDLIAQLVDETSDEARKYLDSEYVRFEYNGFPFYARLGSDQINWEIVLSP